VEPLTRGLPPPDPRSLCPLPSTEFVEPPEKVPGYATEWLDILVILLLNSAFSKHVFIKMVALDGVSKISHGFLPLVTVIIGHIVSLFASELNV
jgi:hypothetical protein